MTLEERMGLDLVDRRGDLVVLDEVDEPVGVEVGDADCLDQAVAVEVLHGAPGAVAVAERLVDQVQVEMVQAQPPQRPIEGALDGLLAGTGLDPQLGGDERSSCGMPLLLMARPTASSLP
jgi:hypothetical protein